jgi:predicted glycoside hydrolase/deacetylase ChbG (UPF0249 family)
VIPAIAEALARCASRYGVSSVRVADEPIDSCDWIEHPRFDFLCEVAQQSHIVRGIYSQHGIASATQFAGLSCMGADATLQRYSAAIARAKSSDSTIEIMVHPGFRCPAREPFDDFSRSIDREHELALLCSDEMQQLLREQRVRVCSWDEV